MSPKIVVFSVVVPLFLSVLWKINFNFPWMISIWHFHFHHRSTSCSLHFEFQVNIDFSHLHLSVFWRLRYSLGFCDQTSDDSIDVGIFSKEKKKLFVIHSSILFWVREWEDLRSSSVAVTKRFIRNLHYFRVGWPSIERNGTHKCVLRHILTWDDMPAAATNK